MIGHTAVIVNVCLEETGHFTAQHADFAQVRA
jgi:hypothetical protein